MENFQISSKVLNVTTIRSWSLWMDSSLADSSLRGRERSKKPSPCPWASAHLEGGAAHTSETSRRNDPGGDSRHQAAPLLLSSPLWLPSAAPSPAPPHSRHGLHSLHCALFHSAHLQSYTPGTPGPAPVHPNPTSRPCLQPRLQSYVQPPLSSNIQPVNTPEGAGVSKGTPADTDQVGWGGALSEA